MTTGVCRPRIRGDCSPFRSRTFCETTWDPAAERVYIAACTIFTVDAVAAHRLSVLSTTLIPRSIRLDSSASRSSIWTAVDGVAARPAARATRHPVTVPPSAAAETTAAVAVSVAAEVAAGAAASSMTCHGMAHQNGRVSALDTTAAAPVTSNDVRLETRTETDGTTLVVVELVVPVEGVEVAARKSTQPVGIATRIVGTPRAIDAALIHDDAGPVLTSADTARPHGTEVGLEVPVKTGAVAVRNGAVAVRNGAVAVRNGAVPVRNGAVVANNGAVPRSDVKVLRNTTTVVAVQAQEMAVRVGNDAIVPVLDTAVVPVNNEIVPVNAVPVHVDTAARIDAVPVLATASLVSISVVAVPHIAVEVSRGLFPISARGAMHVRGQARHHEAAVAVITTTDRSQT